VGPAAEEIAGMNDATVQRSVGRTGISVSTLGFGTTAIAGIMRETPAQDAAEAVGVAWASGLRYYDTAPQYGAGLAEQRLGAALRTKPRSEFVLSTKVGKLLVPSADPSAVRGLFQGGLPNDISYDYTHDGTLRSIEESLTRLGLDRIDIVFIHDVNRRYHGDGVHERYKEAMGGAVKALQRLRREGVIRAFGPGLNDIDILLGFIREADIDCLMLPRGYSLLNQGAAAEVLPECVHRNISVMIASPFESGILATGAVAGATYLYQAADADTVARVRRIEDICGQFGVPLPAVALQYAARHPAVASVVVGMRSEAEVRQNMRLMSTPIQAELWSALAREGIATTL
jgi:D-threo-aldose 1-dehydrogenase